MIALLPVWCSAALLCPTHALDGASAPAGFGSRAVREVLYDEPGDDAIYAVGRGWKARFGCDGASFIPFLGSDAPHDEIVRFDFCEVSVDGAVLEIGPNVGAARSGDTITYERGIVDEIYKTSLDGLEHVVVVRKLPRRGELVVRCAITTGLSACNTDGAVEFRCERGGVRYSSAVALDARGRSRALAARVEDGSLVLRVPAEMVRDAELPITIDPLIQVFGVASTTADERAPDAAAIGDVHVDLRAEVWESVWSQTDHDVMLRTTTFGTPALYVIDATTDFWSAPKVASIVGAKPWSASFDVVSAVGLPSSGARRIFGRTRGLYTGLSGPVVISAGPGDHHSPDIGGDPVSGLNSYLVVWQRDRASGDRDVLGELLSTSGSPLATRDFANDPLQDDTRPAVSKTNSVGLARWGVVWERHVSSTNRDIWGASCAYGPVSTPVVVSATPDDEGRPSISSFDGASRYVVAYERHLGGRADILLRVFDGTLAGAPADLALLEGGAHAPLDQVLPSIDGDASGYLVAYKEGDPLASDSYRTRVTSFALTMAGAVQVHEPHVPVGLSTPSRTRACVSSDAAQSGGSVAAFEVVWGELATSPDHGVWAGFFVDGASSGTVVARCSGDGTDTACPCGSNGGTPAGCPNSSHVDGAEATWSGVPRIGIGTFIVHATHLPPHASALLAQGTASVSPAALFGDGLACIGGMQVRITMRAADAAGDLVYPGNGEPAIWVLGGVPAGGGLRLYQVVYRDTAMFCTPAAWNTTNALAVTWSP